ncbi:Type IV secretion system protein VirB4 [Candidatus Fokinia solitaria]|uniref:Type IV secretion system protein virB4 n=1 Tax=Candidatus Fokinia solitaria TaxID=1802984 RepID=A0A2U8BRG8_9RICK|nr:VirB4 family type IV secretion/conjugal transfer ATPase [Candidatus Fokinia solitaria]AWD32932.1 Type IV secretion system protein VirB4 [Candidatus Fokinia solitaria]
MFKFFPGKAPNWTVFSNEYQASGFIKYTNHLDQETVITDDNSLIKVISLSGFPFETADDEALDSKKDIRNSLFKGMANENIVLYFYVIRSLSKGLEMSSYSSMPEGFAMLLEKKWQERYRHYDAFVNDIYVAVVVSIKSSGSVLDKITGNVEDNFKLRVAEAYEQLDDATKRIVNTLKDYSPRILSIKEKNGSYYSEPFSFFSRVIDGDQKTEILYVLDNLGKYVVNKRLSFKKRHIEIKQNNNTTKYAGVVSLKEYCPRTWSGIMDRYLKLPFEFIITQSFKFTNKQMTIGKMQIQQNRMIQAEDKGLSQIVEITEALDKATTGAISFGLHHLTITCFGESSKQLDDNISIALVELSNIGAVGVREGVNMEPAFWGQLPGNIEFIVRKSIVSTYNIAGFCSMHNYPRGKLRNNHWGDAVTVLDTTSGTPYYFNFHLRDVGHTMIIGPTGAGKTVMLNFLAAQAQRFKTRLFFFDKDRGAEIFLRALNGKYTLIDPGKFCGFNPLKLPSNGENRAFLLEWLQQLVTSNGETVTAEDISKLQSAIEGAYKLAPEDRKLSNIAPFLGVSGPGTLAGRLEMWIGEGALAKVFDNSDDVVDFTDASVFGFEMAEVLRNKKALGPVLLYLFHRINISLDGAPTMIVLDEAWALIDNPVFGPKIKDWLKVLRKLNAFIVFATQSVEDATKSAISDTLVQQTATQIFLPNLKATDVYRTVFMLTEREYNLIKATDPGSRYFLIKQGNDAVIAKIDLSGMDDVISILSGRAETVLILDSIIAKYGANPEIWLPKFHKRLKEMQDNE